MANPYFEAAAAPAALIGAKSDHRPHDIHVPRTQSEAGIGGRPWASRAPRLPLPWSAIVVECVLGIAVAAAIFGLLVL